MNGLGSGAAIAVALVGQVVSAGANIAGQAIVADAQKSAAKTAAKATIQRQQIVSSTEVKLSQQQRAMLVQAAPLLLGSAALIGMAYVLSR